MNYDFCLLINSHITYLNNSCKKLLVTIEKYIDDFPKEKIFIFAGGCSQSVGYQNSTFDGFQLINCPISNFDFTTFIALLETDLPIKKFFFIHDTCVIGPKFFQLISNFDRSHLCKPLLTHSSMNMGMYDIDAIETTRDFLCSVKNEDYSENTLQNVKSQSIMYEDALFNQIKYVDFYSNGPTWHPDGDFYSDFYGTEHRRKIEYYPEIDLLKMKANFNLGSRYIINL